MGAVPAIPGTSSLFTVHPPPTPTPHTHCTPTRSPLHPHTLPPTPAPAPAADGSLYDYECTKDTSVQTGLTILHFLVLVLVFVPFMLLSLLLYAVAERRRVSRMRALPDRRLPAFQDSISSRRLRQAIAAGLVRASSDEICYSLRDEGGGAGGGGGEGGRVGVGGGGGAARG